MTMVRSVIPDSDVDSGEETSPYNFSSTIRPAAVLQQSPTVRAVDQNRDNANTDAVTTQENADAQLILGTGSTDSAVFQQIYNQHQLSTDATLSTPASQPNNHAPITQIILDHSTPTLSIPNAAQSTPQPAREFDSFGTTSSANTIKKLKRSKTSINDSSFTSTEASTNSNKMKRARSLKSYPHTVEGSSQDIVINVADTGSYTTLTRGSQEGNLKYKKSQDVIDILVSGNASHNDIEKDIYDFPGSSATGPMNRVTKKMGAKTTMDIAKERMKTYGKARRSKTMVAPSSQNTPFEEKRTDDNEEGLDMGSTRMPALNNTRLLSSPPAVHQKEQAPRRSLTENIQRKKEEKAKAQREKAASGAIEVREQAVDSSVSVVKATKSSGNKSSGDKPSSAGHGHPGTPTLPCFDSSQEQADTIKSVIKKVDELVNSPAPAPTPAPAATASQESSPLAISFDKGLVGQSIVVVTEPTDSQKEQYAAVSVTGSEGDGQQHTATLPPVMSPARVRRWSGASSTVANSTWKDRDSGGYSMDKRAPTMEPLSSQPPSSRRANKRSKTGLEETPSKRRGRSASVQSDAQPSLRGSDVVVKSSSRKVRRSKTTTASDEPAKSSSQPRRTHVVKTVTTYEKTKGPDPLPPTFNEVGASTEVVMENTQIELSRGTKRKSDIAGLNTSSEQTKTQEKTQEELDFEMAKKLQEEMDKGDAEPETRAKRRAPSKVDSPRSEPEPVSFLEAAGLPPPEMYKPRLSSRRSKSLSAKADTNAPETFIDGLPRPKKARGKKAASQKEVVSAQEVKTADKENVEPPKETVPAAVEQPAIDDTIMEDAPAPFDDDEGIVVATEMPKSFLNKEKPAVAEAPPAKLFAVPKKSGMTASKVVSAPEEDDDEDAVVPPKKRGRGAKAVVDTDESVDELAAVKVIEQPVVPKTTARGRAALKRAASSGAASKPAPKSKEIVDTDDDEDEDEGLHVTPAARASRSKELEKSAAAKPMAKSQEIINTDASEDGEATMVSKPVNLAKAPTPDPAPVARTPSLKSGAGGVTRKTSAPGFKAPAMTRDKSTSVETDVPQTPRKGKEKGNQEMTPKSTPPGTGSGATSHSPLRGGVVPLRVGLSKKTRLPSLLKIIRK